MKLNEESTAFFEEKRIRSSFKPTLEYLLFEVQDIWEPRQIENAQNILCLDSFRKHGEFSLQITIIYFCFLLFQPRNSTIMAFLGKIQQNLKKSEKIIEG